MNNKLPKPIDKLDVEKALSDIMAAEITQEIDREIFNSIRAIPKNSNPRHCYE